jgi:hypothetical protein
VLLAKLLGGGAEGQFSTHPWLEFAALAFSVLTASPDDFHLT